MPDSNQAEKQQDGCSKKHSAVGFAVENDIHSGSVSGDC